MRHDVGIDARMIRNTGIGTYLRGFLKPLIGGSSGGHFDFALFGGDGEILKNAGAVARYPFEAPIYSVREQWEYPSRLKQCRLWHAPHYNIPVWKGNTKLVVTIHDLIHWIFRRDYFSPLQALYAGVMLRRAVHLSDHVITVSQKTKQDLVKYFQADPGKISVIYEGVDEKFFGAEPAAADQGILKKYALPAKYFLYVGLIKPHKRVDLLIRAFERLRREKGTEAGLVIVGKKSSRYPKGYEFLADIQSGNGITYLESIEHEELASFYRGALALVHPSQYEGFGLTLLEAMACRTPVIACRVASIPEVAGEAACLIPPGQEEPLRHAMLEIESNGGLREALIAKGLQQVQKFRWPDTARQTAAVYQKVLN